MYPPIVIIPGGQIPGEEWKPSSTEKNKDLEAFTKLE